jgi:transcriptional regulator GlxA family with amidase domain
MDTLEALKAFKKPLTFSKAAQKLGISERQLIRWVKEEHAISPAWKALLDQRLNLA